jgi:hypothetical protein
MNRLVQTIMRIMPQRDAEGVLHLNRFARASSYDRSLAAFKAEQAKRAARNTRNIPGEWQSSRH